MLVANPVGAENEIGFEAMAVHIAEAQRAAEEDGISGKAVTPYLLAHFHEATQGASLEVNVEVILRNAALAAQIAAAYAHP